MAGAGGEGRFGVAAPCHRPFLLTLYIQYRPLFYSYPPVAAPRKIHENRLYAFGNIIIDGTTYTADVIVYPDHVDSSWWRKEGHSLHRVDLIDVVSAKPDVLIIGRGYYGAMKVPEETIAFIESKGIEVHAERTEKAVELFNTVQGTKATVAVLHLTC